MVFYSTVICRVLLHRHLVPTLQLPFLFTDMSLYLMRLWRRSTGTGSPYLDAGTRNVTPPPRWDLDRFLLIGDGRVRDAGNDGVLVHLMFNDTRRRLPVTPTVQ